ncbi:MAG TPA: ABC transporter ATP-binding protein, partial [Streptosporangiaceae bacterium]|nr:ABC transporter ATP-binding protein [Streptosporangiaceae bacterium]
GRLIDLGTNDELMRRCPEYRLLLAGPGDDAEGVDADEIAYYRNEPESPAAVTPSGTRQDGVTPSLWPDLEPADSASAAGQDQLAGAAAAGIGAGLISGAGAGAGRGAGAAQRGTSLSGPATGGGWLAGIPASPELLAKVAALPPADESPGVDQSFARAPDRHFTLRRLLRPFAIALAIGLILDGLDALASTVSPLLVRGGIDNGVERTALSAGARFEIIALVSVIGLAIVLADWAVNWQQAIVVGRNGERLLYTLRVKIFAHLQRLGLDFYERELTGRIMTRMTTDVDALSSFFQTGLITMVNSVLTFFVVLALMLIINLRLGLILCTVLPVLIVATVVFRRKSSRAYTEARERVSVVNADLQENVSGLRVAQAYRREQVNSRRFAGLSGSYRQARLRAQRMIALYFPFVQALSTIGGAVVLFAAAGEIRSGAITVGSLIAYLLWVDSLFAPVQQMSQVFDGYQQASVGLQRIKALLQTPTSTPPPAHPTKPGRLRGAIELRDVHFGYAGQKQQAIRGVNLSVRPGETVALVGQTGAGKSTLVKLVARFYDVTSGSVTIDGTDVRDYDLAAYRQRLGVVPQEPYLFAGTVRDAIAYGRPDASDAEVEAAARGVGAIGMISRLPGGFRHEVAERGRNLAAGQRQLIALARAYLVDPAILLLDEATAALDLAAEAEVSRATEELAARRTTLVVAHRLTTAAKADRIVVLDGGQIAEIGAHDELLTRHGTYAAMWAAFTGEAQLVG